VSVPGAEVWVDGANVGPAPLADDVFVPAGSHRVEAKLAGYEAAPQAVEAKEGGSEKVTLTLAPIAPPQPPPVVPVQRRSVVPAVVMGGIGGAALITGSVLIGLGVSNRSNAKSLSAQTNHSCIVHDPAPQGLCAQLASAATRADTLGNGGIVALVIAGAAAVGVTTYMLWPGPRLKATAGSRLQLLPTASVHGGGVTLSSPF
jgi:hypothetical protein